MIIVGIDVGLGLSHAALVRQSAEPGAHALGPRMTLLEHGSFVSQPDGLSTVSALLSAWQVRHGWAIVAVGVEVARGSIASERDADPVLRNNIVAGAILADLRRGGWPAAPVASGGDADGWNWRTALGVTGKGPAARDRSVAALLAARLDAPLPTGPKGGRLTDVHDAAGLAIALHDRLRGLGYEGRHDDRDVRALLAHRTPLELAVLANKQTNKRVRRVARAAKGA